ncbi:MAG: fumarylacetoacetate hydrolase family protein [Anaerolineales bacterium]
MKLVTFLSPENPRQPQFGALIQDSVVEAQAACTWAAGAAGLSREEIPASLNELLYAGEEKWEYLRRVLTELARAGDISRLKGPGHRPLAHSLRETRLLPPLQPLSLRDAYAFERHVKTANENRGRPVPQEWYQFPVFYYTNPHNIFGHQAAIPNPRYTQALDYELEIAAVIGKGGQNLGAEEAASHIFGFTIFNDWSARDIQRQEMKAGLGPAKGKDFASSLGPCLVSVDELADRVTGRPGVFDLAMSARINGEIRSQGNFKEIFWSFGEILARISEACPIFPGEVIGSGTVGSGCLLELTKAEGPWLAPGDVVELEIERIGVLQNRISG